MPGEYQPGNPGALASGVTPGMHGYHGQYLRLDVSDQTAQAVPLDEAVLRQFLGGVGLGAWLLLQEWPADLADTRVNEAGFSFAEAVRRWPSVQQALHPRAPFVCAFSPLVGSPLTTSARCALVACSPLTGRLNDALCGSQWALAGKRTGFDAIVIRGACAEPSVVLLDEARLKIVPAQRWWGLSTSQTEQALQDAFGRDWAFLVIGPAGENLVRYATVSHARRHAGRGGLGAVFGAKRIKAIGVRGQRRCSFAYPRALAEYARRLSRTSLGPATAKYRELGTVANLEVFARLGILPRRNFAVSETPVRPAGDNATPAENHDIRPLAHHLVQARLPIRQGCVACTIGCEHLYQADQPVRLEYESLFALGPMCGITDAAVVLDAARLCDELGLDTISTGGTLAWAMACAERGWLAVDLHFGDGAAVLAWIRRIASRQGLGQLLAEGSRIAASVLGPQAEEVALQIKGLELPGYDIRKLPHLALGLAVNARGADHNRSSAYDADFAPQQQLSPQAWASRVVECENLAALLDSLILCKFLRHAIADWYEEAATMLRLVVGWDVTSQELRTVVQRIIDTKKRFNVLVGWTEQEDVLPPALLPGRFPLHIPSRAQVPQGSDYRCLAQDVVPWDEHRFYAARLEYYRLRSWDALGRPCSSS